MSPPPPSSLRLRALAVHRKATLATSDKDFAHLEKKLDILWTT